MVDESKWKCYTFLCEEKYRERGGAETLTYDTIILGATFAAAGIAAKKGENCLILDRRPQAGYEFINALRFGTGQDEKLVSHEAKELHKKFEEKGAYSDGRVCLFSSACYLYQGLENKNVLLNVELISCKKNEALFEVMVHGVSGYRTFYAKEVVDTRVLPDMIRSKTLNLLINSKSHPSRILPYASEEKYGYPGDVLIKIPVKPEAGYIEARRQVKEYLEKMPAGYKASFVADCFDWTVEKGYPTQKNGIYYLPSAMYPDPLLAFDAGVLFALGGDR